MSLLVRKRTRYEFEGDSLEMTRIRGGEVMIADDDVTSDGTTNWNLLKL